jgi:hypothetical protein
MAAIIAAKSTFRSRTFSTRTPVFDSNHLSLTVTPGRSKLVGEMKRAILLTVLLASALSFGQKFDVSDLSASDSPISFTGRTMIIKTGTACVVTAHNKSSHGLLAVRITTDAATSYQWDQPVEFQYDGFFKESGIAPGLDFDVVDEGAYSAVERTYVNGSLVEPPSPNFLCHAKAKVLFVQFEDGSDWGDYEIKKDVMAHREKNMATLARMVEAYDTNGPAAFDAALNQSEMKVAFYLKGEAEYRKIAPIELARKRLAAAQKHQASGIF